MAPANTPERRSHIINRASPAAGIGSVSRTPRFIFGSTAPSSAASQFAATPRFHFPERGGHDSDVETDIGDAVPPSSALADVGRQTGDSPCTYSREDEIQDSNSDEEEILFHDDSSSSPLMGYTETQNDEGGFDVDAEIDSIFPPTPERRKSKRRRVSSPALDNPNADTISSCPSHPSASPSSSQPHSPVSSIASPTIPFRQVICHESVTPLLPSSTVYGRRPSSPTEQPYFRLHHHHQPSSYSISTPVTSSFQMTPTSAPTPSQRRQPHFIFPLTHPNPPENFQNTQSLDRRSFTPGRTRRSISTPQNCVPGGMAASVRGWLLEAEAAKHASQFHSTQTSSTQGPREMKMLPPARPVNYYLVAEVVDIHRQASSDVYTSGHPAPVTLIISTPISNASTASASGTASTSAHRTVPSAIRQEPSSRKILVFGDPISTPSRTQNRSISDTPGQHPRRSASSFQPTHTVSKGDRIGIRRGLVWEMEIEEFGSNRPTREGREGVDCFLHVAGSTDETRGQDVRVEKWVVGVEWDIL
ncbi:hypothetical protein I7I51_05796 [Histoplasma capsulatum]|uniref:Uncharacterized protein n=1 Tax=Ajellomyces capsulatus TaxID=5037 RepID=A0A8A1M4N2_AJECA|nr:hypothetical protein I7I51_05796 [Histoplasma capsulatum]